MRRNPDSKLAFKENVATAKIVDKTTTMLMEETSKRSQRQIDELRHSRDSLLVSTQKDVSGISSIMQPHSGSSCLLHQHCADDHPHAEKSHSRNPGRLFAGNMTPEEMALVLEAAQALVDPPERFSSKSKSLHKHSATCFAQNERCVIPSLS